MFPIIASFCVFFFKKNKHVQKIQSQMKKEERKRLRRDTEHAAKQNRARVARIVICISGYFIIQVTVPRYFNIVPFTGLTLQYVMHLALRRRAQ